MNHRTLSWLALPFALSCASCGAKPIRIAAPPAERFAPVPEPAFPVGDSDAEVAGYLIDLTSALRQANDRLLWLRDWRESSGSGGR
jgi:hypothetical protein